MIRYKKYLCFVKSLSDAVANFLQLHAIMLCYGYIEYHLSFGLQYMYTDFKTAYLRLQEIAQIIKSSTIIDIEELVQLQAEAKSLYEFLQSKLLSSPAQDDAIVQ